MVLPRLRRPSERGSVTAETAVALPALVVVLALAMWAVGAVTAQLRCVDAARLGARAVARGESAQVSRAAALEAAPRGATVTVRRQGDLVVVQVRARARLPGGWGGDRTSLAVQGRAVAPLEDTGDVIGSVP
jgi:hypothetical protein